MFLKNIHNIAVLIEFLAGAGLAIFFHLVLHNPEVAYIIFGIGILLSLATYLLRESLDSTRLELISQYEQAHEVTFALSKITDAECHTRAEELLSGIKGTIVQLQQGFIPLDQTEFYLEGAKCSDLASKRVKTVDPISNGWHNRGTLVNYYQSNLRAVHRGVKVTKVFVMNRHELEQPDTQKILCAQHRDGIEVRIAFREELPGISKTSESDINSSFDFAIYDDKVATEVFSKSGVYFGRKTGQAVNVDKFLKLYELIEHSSNIIAIENDRIVIASDSLI